jgi:hypothetical protein
MIDSIERILHVLFSDMPHQSWLDGRDASFVIPIEFSDAATFVATYATSAAPLWRSYPSDADLLFG